MHAIATLPLIPASNPASAGGGSPILALLQLLLQTYPVFTLVLLIAMLLVPILATTAVLTWHGLRGSNPGPAAASLLKLVELILPRRRGRR